MLLVRELKHNIVRYKIGLKVLLNKQRRAVFEGKSKRLFHHLLILLYAFHRQLFEMRV